MNNWCLKTFILFTLFLFLTPTSSGSVITDSDDTIHIRFHLYRGYLKNYTINESGAYFQFSELKLVYFSWDGVGSKPSYLFEKDEEHNVKFWSMADGWTFIIKNHFCTLYYFSIRRY